MRSLEDDFRNAVREKLQPLRVPLIAVLKKLIEFSYVDEVVSIQFEVFSDSFTCRFPVRAFFMDADNCEYFVYEGSEAKYPCDVDPKLLNIPCVYDRDFERSFTSKNEDLDSWGLATVALIEFFADCWSVAGGERFTRDACIASHDGGRVFDLVRQKWLN